MNLLNENIKCDSMERLNLFFANHFRYFLLYAQCAHWLTESINQRLLLCWSRRTNHFVSIHEFHINKFNALHKKISAPMNNTVQYSDFTECKAESWQKWMCNSSSSVWWWWNESNRGMDCFHFATCCFFFRNGITPFYSWYVVGTLVCRLYTYTGYTWYWPTNQ